MDTERIAFLLQHGLTGGWASTADGVAWFESITVVNDELLVRYRLGDGRPLEALVSVRELDRVDTGSLGGRDASDETLVGWLGIIIDEGMNNARPDPLTRRIKITVAD